MPRSTHSEIKYGYKSNGDEGNGSRLHISKVVSSDWWSIKKPEEKVDLQQGTKAKDPGSKIIRGDEHNVG